MRNAQQSLRSSLKREGKGTRDNGTRDNGTRDNETRDNGTRDNETGLSITTEASCPQRAKRCESQVPSEQSDACPESC